MVFHVIRSAVVAVAVTVSSACAFADADLLLSQDCRDSYRHKATGVGTFCGELPKGICENFTAWVPVRVESSMHVDGDGSRYVTFSVGRGNRSQFTCGKLSAAKPALYRITVVMRSRSERAAEIALRQHGKPYRTLWQASVRARREWQTRTYHAEVKVPSPDSFGVYLYLPTGEHDFRRVTVEEVDESDYQATIRRPPLSVVRFARHTRFPLGLPNGWNLACDSLGAAACADSAVSGMGGMPTLRFDAPRGGGFFSEPMQTSSPTNVVRVALRYRAEGSWRIFVLNGDGDRWNRQLLARDLAPAASWTEGDFPFLPARTGEAFVVKFEGSGRLWLDAFDATIAPKDPKLVLGDRPCALRLDPAPGEAAEGRVHFLDEPAVVIARTFGAPAGAKIVTEISTVYGERLKLADETLPPSGEVQIRYDRFPKHARGAVLVAAHLADAEGRSLTPVEEIQMTRIVRPHHWGRSAPDSPFGTHLVADRHLVVACKAGGVNWTRFHDAGTEYSGWWKIEPRKGDWHWPDREIALFRELGVRMFAQLGTAPDWATHFHDLGCAELGYFEKYFRPTNVVDWVTYVKAYVSRYRGVIDDYFVWNEPWGHYWKSSADSRYFDADKAARDFGRFQKLTHEAVRAANPAARVSGFNTSSGGAKWTAGCLEGDPRPGCEIVDFHAYFSDARLVSEQEEPVSGPCLDPIRSIPGGLSGKEIWMSEGQGNSSGDVGGNGRMTGLYRATLPFAPETPEQMHAHGDQQCRYVISLLSEGVSKVFLYTTHACHCLGVPPSFQVLIGADGYPHPSLAAHAHMAWMIEGRRFVSRGKFGAEGVRVTFGNEAGEVSAYANLTAAEAIGLARCGTVTDLYGNPFDASTWIGGTLLWKRDDTITNPRRRK